MFDRKEAPAIALGLLLLFCSFPLCADGEQFSIGGSTGTLWVEEDGASGYWQGGFSYRYGGKIPFYAALNTVGLRSTLPWADLDAWGFGLHTGIDTKPVSFRLDGGFFQHSRIDAIADGKEIYNEGGELGYFNLAVPVSAGDFTIEPSYLYGFGSWDNGSFYWFFGKPDLPALHSLGLSAGYAKRHSLNFNYLFAEPAIINQFDEHLFDSRLDCFTLSYKISLDRAPFAFTGTLGWFYAVGKLEGAVTTANQHYPFFPYRFYNVDAELNAHIGYAALDMNYRRSLFQYHVVLGAVHGFSGEASANIHYKKINFYGGAEDTETLTPLRIEGLGAAFLLLDAGIPALRIGQGKYLAISLSKLFAIPWGYEQFTGGKDTGGGTGGGASGQWIRSILLSGLFLNVNLRF